MGDGQRLQESIVGEIDARVFRAERMAASRCDREAEALQARGRGFQVGDGKDAVIEPAGLAR